MRSMLILGEIMARPAAESQVILSGISRLRREWSTRHRLACAAFPEIRYRYLRSKRRFGPPTSFIRRSKRSSSKPLPPRAQRRRDVRAPGGRSIPAVYRYRARRRPHASHVRHGACRAGQSEVRSDLTRSPDARDIERGATSALRTKRRLAVTHQFGRYWRHSGHPAKPFAALV
jgi:hypothetical protein